MDLILLVLGLAFVGVVVELINRRLPIDPMIRRIIYVVIVIVMVLYLIRRFGGNVPNVLP